MSLAAGSRLGPYEVVGPLGAGGMGEVYRARDTRLDRIVAIKILPREVSKDALRKQRFEREAKTISSLNHPHICVLYDVGHHEGIDYLVMECIEGESLAQRLEKGALPLEQVLKYGAQIADGLDKAHRGGVVHRDLKPGNIMLTKTGAKLLDFGLAKPTATAASAITLTAAATPVTAEGLVVGTFQYMSPEQVEGKEVDGRSDIFALGAVLYEMLTGRKAFEGKSQLSVASAILEKEPEPITVLKPTTPLAMDHVIRKCLAKNPDERWQSAADIKHELEWIAQSSAEMKAVSAPARQTRWWRTGALLLGVIALSSIAAAIGYFSNRHAISGPVVRATLALPPNVTLLTLGDHAGAPALSPDGSQLVFVGAAENRVMLFLRSMDNASAKPLPGTENGKFPFWSPDSKSVGFFADQQLKRVDLAGGPPMSLAKAVDPRGRSWAGDTIIFSPYIYEPIYRVAASGGKAIPITSVDQSQYSTHRWPHFLPDGKHFLYLAGHHLTGNAAIYVGNIDGRAPKFVLNSKAAAFYASGHILHYRDGSLMAQNFDPARLELKGEARPIGPVLRETGNWGVIATASDNGLLLYQSAGEVKYPISWFDRTGHAGGSPLSGQLEDLRLSPDGSRVATVIFDGPVGRADICDLKSGARTRLTFGEEVWYVVWSPDGKKIGYSAQKANSQETELYLRPANGSGDRELLLSSGSIDHPTDWTRDGRYVVIDRGKLGAQRIWVLPMFGDRKPFLLFPSATFDHSNARVSPNGKWIAYYSSETGPQEVFVSSFPDGHGKWQISNGGANPAPLWRADGKELYFETLDGNLSVASIHESGESIVLDGVKPLMRSPFLNGLARTIYDVDPSGQRFLGSAAPDTSVLPLNVITNWDAQWKNR